MQSAMPPALRWGVAAFVLGFLALWGLGFLTGGLVFLLRAHSKRMLSATLLAIVASTPLWAPYLVRAARLLGEDALIVDILLREFTIQKFLGFRLPEPLPDPGSAETVRYDWASSRHTAGLGAVTLARPARTFATDDEAYRALVDELTARTVAKADADLLVLFAELRKDEHEGADLAEPFLDALRAVSLDSARFPAVPRFARTVLAHTLTAMQFDPHAFARAERLRRVQQLLAYPDATVAERARAFVTDAQSYERRSRRTD
jgi:hypothetical protein